jgi:P-type E1-E2 ATPase
VEVLRANGGGANDVAVVETARVKSGDIVLVRPGKRVPVDGLVVEGSAFIDQSAITGELNPVEVTRSSIVYAGSVSKSAPCRSGPIPWEARRSTGG